MSRGRNIYLLIPPCHPTVTVAAHPQGDSPLTMQGTSKAGVMAGVSHTDTEAEEAEEAVAAVVEAIAPISAHTRHFKAAPLN